MVVNREVGLMIRINQIVIRMTMTVVVNGDITSCCCATLLYVPLKNPYPDLGETHMGP